MKSELSSPLKFKCGKSMKNRFMLAPMTNTQSHEDGRLSKVELNWLEMRARGGFGMVMTCACHVQENGKGFNGQLGIFSDKHISGHIKLCEAISTYDSLAIIQLFHAGMRSPSDLIEGKSACPSEHEKYNSRALTFDEIQVLKKDFVQAAIRAKKSGYHGVEIHGAHGYILCQFLSAEINKRTDEYGGSLENRSRLIFEIVKDIRSQCGNQFMIGVRLSPERFGMKLSEIKTVSQKLIDDNQVDFLDISLWDSFKLPEEEAFKDKTLLEHFLELDRKETMITVAGNIRTGNDVRKIMTAGIDFVSIGRAAILHHDFPQLVMEDATFTPKELPVTSAYLKNEGLGSKFIEYMSRWPDFVS